MNDFFRQWPKTGYTLLVILILFLGVLTLKNIGDLFKYGKVEKYDRNEQNNTIVISGQGKIVAKPDIAQIKLGVQSTGRTAVEVATLNNTTYNSVLAAVKKLGIDEKDIKTTAYNLNPRYRYEPNTGKSSIDGYDLYQEITVKVRKLDSVGQVIAEATAAGSNQVGDINFTIDDTDALKVEARLIAIKEAKDKAQEIAEATGLKLGKLVNFSESSELPQPKFYFGRGAAVMSDKAEGVPSPEVQAGSQEVIVNVNLTYSLK